MNQSQIGVIGLAAMGANFARNFASRDHHTSVYNRTNEVMEKFIEKHSSEYLHGQKSLENFVNSLQRPRKIILMIKAGRAVDSVIDQLSSLLDAGDIIIDGGNSYFGDTIQRFQKLSDKNIEFVGCGISGGEEGALLGPSLMPGCSEETWSVLKPYLESVAAKDFSGNPCVTHVGTDGAGHYVKMVHNGIEYGVMQMMAEAYDIFRRLYNLSAPEIAKIFATYNQGKLQSYLFEIIVPVLERRDSFEEGYLVDYILDKAGQKGTGKWTAIDALQRGVSLPSITEAVFARFSSSQKKQRQILHNFYQKEQREQKEPLFSLEECVLKLEQALYGGMLSIYSQGYDLIQRAGQEQGWEIRLGEVSRIWEGGCIIRAQILNTLHQAYNDLEKQGKSSTHFLEVSALRKEVMSSMINFREIVRLTIDQSIAAPSLTSALTYIDSMTNKDSSANLIQGLRDFFGAHTYERIDREGIFHTRWNENTAEYEK